MWNKSAIFIDGLRMGTINSAGILHGFVGKGAYHNIQIMADSYETYSSSQYIEADHTTLSFIFSKSHFFPRIFVYDVDNDMNPISFATIIVDGKTVGTTDEYGRAAIKDITAGTYALEVTKPNYVSYKEKAIVGENFPDTIVKLSYVTVSLTILVVDENNQISWVTIYINNLVVGITDATEKFAKGMEPRKTIPVTVSKDESGYITRHISWSVTVDQTNIVTMLTSQDFWS
jgi:hypothetical protein